MTFAVDVANLGNRHVLIKVFGEIDYTTASDLRATISDAIDQLRPHRIDVDLASVTLLDSTGIGILVVAYRISRHVGIEFTVHNQNALVDRMLCAVGVRDLLCPLPDTAQLIPRSRSNGADCTEREAVQSSLQDSH
jgi:anti-anti-sigma factor